MSQAHRPRRTLRRFGAVLTGLLLIIVILYLSFYIVADRALNRMDIDASQKTVASKDGTLIAFEQTGAGPVVVVVALPPPPLPLVLVGTVGGTICAPEFLVRAIVLDQLTLSAGARTRLRGRVDPRARGSEEGRRVPAAA